MDLVRIFQFRNVSFKDKLVGFFFLCYLLIGKFLILTWYCYFYLMEVCSWFFLTSD